MRKNFPGLAGSLLEGSERGAHAFEAAADGLGVAAEPDSEVLRAIEKFSRHYAGLELLA